MRKDQLRSLFSRMLATYMTVTLGLLLLTGVTVTAILQGRSMRERKAEMQRETVVANALLGNAQGNPSMMLDAERDFLRMARHYDGILQLVYADGNAKSYYENGKWAPIAAIDFTEADIRTLIVSAGEGGVLTTRRFEQYVDLPVLTSSRLGDYAVDGQVLILFHRDLTDLNTETVSVLLEMLLISMFASLVALIIVYSSTTALTKPFMEINDIVQRYSKGDYNARIPISGTQEATQLALSFNAMADQLKDLEATRRSFVANVSHELRSPLTSMRGFLEAMQDGTISPEDYEKYIDVVLSETRRMTTMVNDLLDLARIESGKTALRLEVFDINELIRRTLITFEARIYEKRMEVEVKFAQDQCLVEADSAQISQVLRNLIDNAIKYSPDESRLRIATYAMRREVFVSIQDNGQGIPEEDVPHVFDRFYKVEKAHTPSKMSGTGLGLSIVKRIIDQHGQTITLKSAKGKGSTFTFTLRRVSGRRLQQLQDGGDRYGV